jgi:hypothetical protein
MTMRREPTALVFDRNTMVDKMSVEAAVGIKGN